MLLLQPNDDIAWLAPYAYAVVLIGFLLFLFRIFENWFADKYNRPLIRHYFTYKKLSPNQKQILESEFTFYKKLSPKFKRQFEHRVVSFINSKKFVGREGVEITDRMKVLIAAIGCMLSFGRKHYLYSLIEHILIYPDTFYSTANEDYHVGEFNPAGKALVLSWKVFEEGYKITNDNLNLGIHEFMHAMQLESKQSRDIDSTRFAKQFQNILKRLTTQEVKDKLDQTRYFREYAFTNQYEFMAVLAEYFIESPKEFNSHFPVLYDHTKKLLNFNFSGY